MKIELLAIGEVKPDWASTLIQRALDTDYSHIGILINGVHLWHATEVGFHMIPWATFEPGHVVRHRFEWEVKDGTYQEGLITGWLIATMGKEYSTSQYLGFIFPMLRSVKIIANGNSKLVCSEAGGQFLYDTYLLRDHRLSKCDWLDPKKIVEICYESRRAG